MKSCVAAQGGFSTMNLMVTPVAPGRSRVTFRLLTNLDNKFIRYGAHFPRHRGSRSQEAACLTLEEWCAGLPSLCRDGWIT